MSDHTHYVYRCYGADDRLLYVGCTSDIGARFAVHYASYGNPPSSLIRRRMVRKTVTEYPTKAAARAAEREAIRTELPLGNIHHIPGRTAQQRDDEIAAYLGATQPIARIGGAA